MDKKYLRMIFRLTVLFFLTTVAATTFGCGAKSEYTQMDFSKREPVETPVAIQSSETVLRVGIAGVISPVETVKSYGELVSYLGQKLNQPVEILQRDTYAEINDLVKAGYVDFAFVCSLAYVVGREDFGMELLVVPEMGGTTVYHSYIIVPADSEVMTLTDLRGKVFAFTDPLSNSGRLSPTYMLHEMEETPQNFFSRYIFTYGHDNSVGAIAEGLVDGAAVDSLVYDYITSVEPHIGAETRVINISPPYGIPPVVTHPGLDPEIKSRLRSLLLNMDKDATGKQILDSLLIDRFVLGDDVSYDLIRTMKGELGW